MPNEWCVGRACYCQPPYLNHYQKEKTETFNDNGQPVPGGKAILIITDGTGEESHRETGVKSGKFSLQ